MSTTDNSVNPWDIPQDTYTFTTKAPTSDEPLQQIIDLLEKILWRLDRIGDNVENMKLRGR